MRIAYKLVIWVGAALLFFGSVYFLGTIRKIENDYIEEVKRGGIRLSDSLKKSFRHAMLKDDKAAVHSAVHTVGKLKDINELRIINKDGVITFSSRKEEIGIEVDLQAGACEPCHQHHKPLKHLTDMERCNIYEAPDGQRSLLMINPIYNGPDCSTSDCHVHRPHQRVLGVMDLSLSLGTIDREASQRKYLFLLYVLGMFTVVSLVIFQVIRRVISRPISNLVEGTRKISAGNLDYKLEEHSNDEIGTLARSFNQMTVSLKETRSQLLQSERLASLGRMAAGIAHEINNPLTGIMMFTSSLEEDENCTEEMKESVDVIMNETKRCREIIRGLLDFARQRQANLQRIDINEAISNSVKIVTSQCQASGIAIDTSLDESIPTMMADAVQLEQVFLNLMINASDAMKSNGTLTVKSHLVNRDEVEIEITDTGHGIPKENLTQIFEPFYSTKGTKGTGLGLAVSWGIVQQHGGTLDVESEVGKGTTFNIRLPLKGK